MAAYASAADMRTRFPEGDLAALTDPEGVTINDGELEEALADACAEVDPYLRARYRLPITGKPRELVQPVCDIAFYRLHAVKDQVTVEEVRTRYEDAVKFFDRVASGKIVLDLSGPDVPGTGEKEVRRRSPGSFSVPIQYGG